MEGEREQEEEKSGVEGEGDDDDGSGEVENIDGGENIALPLNEAHPRTADAVHLFSRKVHVVLCASEGRGVARERVSA